VREAVRLAEANTTVRTLTVDESPEYGGEGASRMACILRSFPNANELVVRPASRQSQRPPLRGVDALLRGMMVGPLANLRVLRLAAAGGGKAMYDFLCRFPNISTVELGDRYRPLRISGDLVEALACHWASRESNLQNLSLRCCRRTRALDMARLLYALGHCPRLQVLDVTVPEPSSVLLDVCFACASSRSIERLTISFALGGNRNDNDASPLWRYRPHFPDSLRSLALRNCRLRLAEADLAHRGSRSSVMETLTSLDLVSCDGAPPSAVLGRFPNLERLHAHAEYDEIVAGRSQFDFTDAELAAFASALAESKVSDLALHVRPCEHLPSIVALLQNGRGSIDLTFHDLSWTNVDNVRRGLEAMSPAVTQLGLRFVRCHEGDADYARFLQILGESPSLERLTMELDSAATHLWPVTCGRLRAMLPLCSLRSLEIREVEGDAYEAVMESCLAGLVQNRYLHELRVDVSQCGDEFIVPAPVVSSLHKVLQSNGTLGEFGRGQFASDDPLGSQVRFLLKQNRLGRRVLLDGASPPGLHPLVLSLVSRTAGAADVLYHYLRAAEAGVLCRPVPSRDGPLVVPKQDKNKKKRPRADSASASSS
jgi:hypothetical protein